MMLPNRQTAIYVAGAWMAQTVLTDEKTQNLVQQLMMLR